MKIENSSTKESYPPYAPKNDTNEFRWMFLTGIIFSIGGLIALSLTSYFSGCTLPCFDLIAGSTAAGVALIFFSAILMDLSQQARVFPFRIFSPKSIKALEVEEEKIGLA